MKMVVGLGNPGRTYDHTPHNAGFDVVDLLADGRGAGWKKSWRFPAKLAECRIGEETVLLVKPQTFMNRSGDAVGPLARKKGIRPEDVLVVVDDADIDLGRLRMRPSGGAGGHNGLKSLIERLGGDGFPRLRVGIGRGSPDRDMTAFVLGRMPAEDREKLDEACRRAADAAEQWVNEGVVSAMNRYNG